MRDLEVHIDGHTTENHNYGFIKINFEGFIEHLDLEASKIMGIGYNMIGRSKYYNLFGCTRMEKSEVSCFKINRCSHCDLVNGIKGLIDGQVSNFIVTLFSNQLNIGERKGTTFVGSLEKHNGKETIILKCYES